MSADVGARRTAEGQRPKAEGQGPRAEGDTNGPDKSPEKIARMFDAIAARYDLLNHLLSLGIDRRWRKRAVEALALGPGDVVLDLCTGTADLALAAVGAAPAAGTVSAGGRDRAPSVPAAGRNGQAAGRSLSGIRVVGVDFAGEMLRLARAKLLARGERRIALVRGDAMRIPLPDASVDAVTIGFGIRNVQQPDVAAREILRVLRPGGRLAVLEFGTPSIPGLRAAYLLYFRRVLPLIGKVVSRHSEAYAYLPASVAAFRRPDEFLALLSKVGFSGARVVQLTFGIVYLFTGRK